MLCAVAALREHSSRKGAKLSFTDLTFVFNNFSAGFFCSHLAADFSCDLRAVL